MTHQQQLEIGAYLLGALPPRERSGFEEHLAACAACRNEVADLAGIPALLGKVSLSDVVAAPPASAPDLPRIETRPDPVPAPAPAAPGDSRTVTLLPTVAGMHGSLVIAGSGTGSVLRLSMGGVRPGQQCSLLVSGGDGARHPIATWTAGYDGDVEMAADSALQPAGIRWVGVTSRDGAVLLQATLAS